MQTVAMLLPGSNVTVLKVARCVVLPYMFSTHKQRQKNQEFHAYSVTEQDTVLKM